MNDRFRQLIQTKLDEKNLTINRLALNAKVSRDVLYRFMARKTISLGSEVLGKVFTYLEIRVTL